MTSSQARDIKSARAKSSFEPSSLTAVIWPGDRRASTDHLVSILSQEKILDKDTRRHLSRQQLLEHAYAIQMKMIELRQRHKWNEDTFNQAMSLVDDHVPFGLHFNAFIPVIRSQGSDEQIAKWIPKCLDLAVIGCYAQTELGHGSNVQGLETTATFDIESQAFLLDSPTLTSTKWWVGGLGTVANHAVVQAQLILPDKNYGPHLFIVPLRDSETHKPFPSIQIGDIGPKHFGGFNMNDNGFARFHKVKVPLENFLCRYAKVDSQGRYTPAGHSKIGYGSMVALRASMPIVLGLELAKCLTIAIRYTTVRRQFNTVTPITTDKVEDASTSDSARNDASEMQVIRYSSVKERLIPLLASSYCYIIAGHSTMALYNKMLTALVNPPHDASLLAEVHLLTSGLKAVLSWNVVAGMEESRKALGGHGFSVYSGIGERFAKEVPGQTYEGDNYVLVQQTAKGLLKNAQLLKEGKVDKMMRSTRFLADLSPSELDGQIDWSNRATSLNVLGLRVAQLLKDLALRVTTEPWSELNMHCVRLTRAFVDYYVAIMFCEELSTLTISDSQAKLALEKLADVFILVSLTNGIPDLAEYGIVPGHSLRSLRETSIQAMNAISEDLVGLTDAFGFSDWELNSVLGRGDGEVYKNLWMTVNEKNPVNTSRTEEVVNGFKLLIKPLHEIATGRFKANL